MTLTFREATAADLPAIVAMLADDPLGAKREDLSDPLNKGYLDAFHAMVAEANQHLIVAEEEGSLVGTFQLSFIPGLSNKGPGGPRSRACGCARTDAAPGSARR